MLRLLKVIILGEERASECVHMREERERERVSKYPGKLGLWGWTKDEGQEFNPISSPGWQP